MLHVKSFILELPISSFATFSYMLM